jgi:hypothetical protein
LKQSPLFEHAPASLFAVMKNSEAIRNHVKNYGRLIFATKSNHKTYEKSELLDIVIAPAATPHHAPHCDSVRNSLFCTLNSQYTGDTQMSKVQFLISIYVSLLKTAELDEMQDLLLMFILHVIISVWSDELLEGAVDGTIEKTRGKGHKIL